ncbi:MAG: type II toxin-antitoxin system VapC family toxin [Hyphomicrobiales bacterium]|nr:type II toxin-antitoxin system VapC family toxin [Hyphomicrobiales bacterium]
MRVLLDTHALLWWLDGDDRLPPAMREVIADPATGVLVSAASAWEIATKVRIGKLPGAVAVAAELPDRMAEQGFAELPVSLAHALRAGGLPGPHRDPFDRMLVAQALVEDLPLVSNERAFDAYAVRRLW